MSTPTVGPDDVGGLTIKFGSGFEAPWFAPRGTPKAITAQVIEAFGLTAEEVEGLAPAEVWVLAAQKIASTWAGKAIESGLGGKRTSGAVNKASRPEMPAGAGKPAATPTEDDPNAGILSAIAEADTQDKLKLAYAKNKAAFEQEQKDGKDVLRTAFKARNQALKGATKEN